MQFTMVDVCGPSTVWELFQASLFLALPVGVLLFSWLRRSARDVRDVLAVDGGLTQR